VTERSLLLADDAVLLHIGAFKTGTTAIQGALFRARPQLAKHGVLQAGKGRQPMTAVLALANLRLKGKPIPQIEQWRLLVAQVAAAADKRVVVSSEFFGAADEETARRAVRELGGPRVHVVVTLRPLAKILPSQWQQYVRSGATRATYDDWLDGVLRRPPYNKPTPSFWKRHSHEVLVERWASIVGPENVTVIVPDEGDRDFLLRSFEELTGLPEGLLVAESTTENRSMTLGEIELVRQINLEFALRDWPDRFFRKLSRQGVAAHLQANRKPHQDEPRILTPQWALDRAAEIGAGAADKITALGVRIVGDISTLGAAAVAEEPSAEIGADRMVAVDAARQAVIGAILSSDVTTTTPIESLTSKELLLVVLGRARVRARRKAARRKAVA
jgi:hypothetical protein